MMSSGPVSADSRHIGNAFLRCSHQEMSPSDITPEVAVLASGILASGIIPPKAATDAAHMAIAAVHRMDFLVTWNCTHIANAAIARVVAKICRHYGCECALSARRKDSWENSQMARDHIVAKVRRVREEQAAKHGFDVKAILAAAKKRQRQSGHKVVSFLPKKRLSA